MSKQTRPTPTPAQMPAYATYRANARAFMTAIGAPMDRANFARLAAQYETAYRRRRVSRKPPTRAHLLGQLRTARAFHSLARGAN